MLFFRSTFNKQESQQIRTKPVWVGFLTHTKKKERKEKERKKDKKNHPSEVIVYLWASRAAVKEAERGLPGAEATQG